MAFTVEDGTGLTDANAYITTAEFTSHHADRGIGSVSDGTYGAAEITGAIVQATDYVEKRFALRYRGYQRGHTQALEWPRTDAYSNAGYAFDPVPRQLKMGVAEYALLVLQLGRNLAPVPGVSFPIVDPATGEVTNQGGGTVKSIREKVDVIETEVEYGDGNYPMSSSGNITTQQIPDYPQADLWIEELLVDNRMVYRG